MKTPRILACNLRPLMLALLLALSVPAMSVLHGCSAIGVQPADTFGKQLIVANGLVESVAVTAETLYSAGKIGNDDAREIYRRAVEARSGIELARVVHATDPTQASNRLSAIILSLQAIDAVLRAKQ